MRQTVAIWAIVDATGELVDAKATRLSAFKRTDWLDRWAAYNAGKGEAPTAEANSRTVLAPFQLVRCVGTFEIEDPTTHPNAGDTNAR